MPDDLDSGENTVFAVAGLTAIIALMVGFFAWLRHGTPPAGTGTGTGTETGGSGGTSGSGGSATGGGNDAGGGSTQGTGGSASTGTGTGGSSVPDGFDTGISCTQPLGNAFPGCNVSYADHACGHDVWKVSCPGNADAWMVCVKGTWHRYNTLDGANKAACADTGGASSTGSTTNTTGGGFMQGVNLGGFGFG